MDVTSQVLVLFFLILIGYGARKLNAIEDGAVGPLSSFVINVSLPALIIVSLQRPFSRELLGEAGLSLGISFAMYAFSFGFAAFYPSLIRADGKSRGVHRYAVVFSNVGFMGFPVVEAVLGPEALFHLAMYNIPFNFLAFSIGAWLIAKDGRRPFRISWKIFINPGVLATVVGFVLFLSSVSLPPTIYKTLKMAGDITSPLSMIAIGAVLARIDPRKVFGSWRIYATSVVRLAVLPALLAAALYAIGLRGLLFSLPVLITAMPVAANTTIMASVYDGDVESASAMIFISTLACIVTIPLVATLLA